MFKYPRYNRTHFFRNDTLVEVRTRVEAMVRMVTNWVTAQVDATQVW